MAEDLPPPPNVVALPHGRVPPHNLDAERSLLGGILLDGTTFKDVADLVSAADFYRDAHRKVYEAIAALEEDDQPIDRITVKERLTELGTLEGAGGEEFIDLLDKIVPPAANLLYYGKIVRDKAVARRIIEAATYVAQVGYDQSGESKELATEAFDRLMGAIEEVKPKPQNRFAIAHTRLSVDELTTDPPPLEFILRPYIPAETVSILSGAGGGGKTTLTSLLAASRALGRRMFDGICPREGETVILTTEDRKVHYRRKFAAIREHLGAEYNPKAIAERVHILDMAGLPVRLVLADRGEQFRPSPEVDELADALHRVAPRADHVIIETISRVTGGVESNAAMSVLVSACERLAGLAKVAVTLVGHVGQNAGRAGTADAYAARGGSALGDNGRSSMVLVSLTPQNVETYAAGLEISDEDLEHTLVWTHPKSNGAASAEPRLLRRLSTRFGPVLDDARYASTGIPVVKGKGKPGRKSVLTYAETRAAILAYVKKHQPVSGNSVIQDLGGNRTNTRALIQDLTHEGALRRVSSNPKSKLTLPDVGPNAGTNSQLNLDPLTTGPVGPNTPLSRKREREGEVIGLATGSEVVTDPVIRTQPTPKAGEVF